MKQLTIFGRAEHKQIPFNSQVYETPFCTSRISQGIQGINVNTSNKQANRTLTHIINSRSPDHYELIRSNNMRMLTSEHLQEMDVGKLHILWSLNLS